MRNSLTRLRVSLEGLTFGLLEMIHWSRFRIVDLSVASPGDTFNRKVYAVIPLLAHHCFLYCRRTVGPRHH